MIESILQDSRYCARSVCRNPGFAAVIVISLALGIGANTAIFSVLDTLALRMLPVRDPAALLSLHGIFYIDAMKLDKPFDTFPPAIYDQIQRQQEHDQNDVFQDVIAFANLERPEGVERAQVVSNNYFAALGVPISPGRALLVGDTNAGVISYGFWRRNFGGAANVIGQTSRRPSCSIARMCGDDAGRVDGCLDTKRVAPRGLTRWLHCGTSR